jgi:4-amino-4-deoxy-L-arabinose transferase-like glycosyltransferase
MTARNLVTLRTHRFLVAVIFALIAGLYLFDLADTPVYFGGDEAHFAVGAHAIATTGRTINGDRLPVFFNLADPLGGKQQTWGDTWYQPVLFYLLTPFVTLLPFTPAAIRLPMAIVGGVITPLLMLVVARRMIGHLLPALAAVLIVALAPVHVVLSRQALDYVLPLPIVLGWLWSLHAFMQTRQPKYMVIAGLLLGAGCYSYIASWALMPTYLLISWITVWRAGAGLRPVIQSGIAFALPLTLAAIWLAVHPEMLAQTATRYGATEGPRHALVATYFSIIDPIVLFVRGGPSLVTSTARSGFVLVPVALLLLAGVYSLMRRRDWIAWVIAAGIVTAPLPAAFKGEPGMIQRAMYLLPFLGLLGGFGFAVLWQSRSRWLQGAAVAVMLAAPVQFGYFYFDYFTHYKFRSAFYYDPAAFRDVAEYLFDAAAAPAYYFTNDVDDASVKWRFYTAGRSRGALLERTHYIEPDDRPDAPPGSLLVTYDFTLRLAALEAAGWTVEKLISDVDNRPAAVILRKRG